MTIAGFQCHAIKNKNLNRATDYVQNLGYERRCEIFGKIIYPNL